MNKLHIMLDLETLGKTIRAPIIQIGAVSAVEDETGLWTYNEGHGFVLNIDFDAAIRNRVPDGSTILWWMQQSEQARQGIIDGQEVARTNVASVLRDFAAIIYAEKAIAKAEEVYVWGNGASSDNAWLNDLYETNGIQTPWEYWGNMCYRTMKNFNRDIPKPAFQGVAHDALDDARNQMAHLVLIMNTLRERRL